VPATPEGGGIEGNCVSGAVAFLEQARHDNGEKTKHRKKVKRAPARTREGRRGEEGGVRRVEARGPRNDGTEGQGQRAAAARGGFTLLASGLCAVTPHGTTVPF
jgi:hypothetical protein